MHLGGDSPITDGVYREYSERVFEDKPEWFLVGMDGSDMAPISRDPWPIDENTLFENDINDYNFPR